VDYEQACYQLVDVQRRYDAAFDFAKQIIALISHTARQGGVVQNLELIDEGADRIIFLIAGRVVCFQFIEVNSRPHISFGTLQMGSDGPHFYKSSEWPLGNNVFTNSRGKPFDIHDVHQQLYVALEEAIRHPAIPIAELVAIKGHLKTGTFLGGVT
jgi:hypothetical protein